MKIVEGVKQVFTVLRSNAGRLNESGQEILDGRPMAPPVGYKKQPSMMDNIREMVRSERLRMEVEAAGAETFEEANDFYVEDDPFPSSDHEFRDEDYEVEEQLDLVREANARGVKLRKKAPEAPQKPQEPPVAKKPDKAPPEAKEE